MQKFSWIWSKIEGKPQQEYEKAKKFRLRQPDQHKTISFYHFVMKNAARRAAKFFGVEKNLRSDLSKK